MPTNEYHKLRLSSNEYVIVMNYGRLPGFRWDIKVNGTQNTLKSKLAIGKDPINLLVEVRITGDL